MKNQPLEVLLVTQYEDKYQLIQSILDELYPSYVLDWAPTDDEAIAYVRQNHYHVLLFDSYLSDKTGINLLSEPTVADGATPVIFLMEQPDDGGEARALRAGAVDYISRVELDSNLLERSIRYAIERGNTLHQLRQNEARYRAVVAGLSEMLVRYDTDFNLTFVNRAYCEYVGLPAEALVGTNALATVHERDCDRLQDEISAMNHHTATLICDVMAAGMMSDVEEWHHWTTQAVLDGAGVLFEYQSVIRDITESKRVETELSSRLDELNTLRRVDAELTDTLKMSSVVFFALDSAGRLSGADVAVMGLYNDEKRELRLGESYGLADTSDIEAAFATRAGIVGEVVTARSARFIPSIADTPNAIPASPETVSQMILPLLSQERFLGLIYLETRLPGRFTQATFEFLQLVTARIAVALDNARLYELQKNQLEELQKLYEQVTKLEQLKTEMIRIASHDLRNPIGVMQGYIEMLHWEIENETNDTQKIHTQLDVMQKMNSRMRKITEDILSVDRIERSTQMENGDTFDLTAVVREVAEEHTYLAQEQEHNFTLHLPDAPTPIRGDEAQLREAVANLINNALKYTPVTGRVDVWLEDDGNAVTFEVKDTGYGIPQELQDRLFEPFYRAKTAETAKIEGTGLGLHLVKNIIERHEGRMIFRSRYKEGSTFGFQIPTHRQEPRDADDRPDQNL